jgi:hypothetical protein
MTWPDLSGKVIVTCSLPMDEDNTRLLSPSSPMRAVKAPSWPTGSSGLERKAVIPEFEVWESFYAIVGAAAGALIGLQFVVMTLIAERRRCGGGGSRCRVCDADDCTS